VYVDMMCLWLREQSHNNRLYVRKVLFYESEPIIDFPAQVLAEDCKVRVKYFRSLDAYSHYLRVHKKV